MSLLVIAILIFIFTPIFEILLGVAVVIFSFIFGILGFIFGIPKKNHSKK